MRPHRVEFIKKVIQTDLTKFGYLTGNKIYFDEYKKIPQYQLLNFDMTLDEFKVIEPLLFG